MSPATGRTAELDFVTWSVPLLPSAVEYPLEVMEEIRAYACDELLGLAHGGREVGGVLFGVRRERAVRILTWRPIACGYVDGDNLHLSRTDALALAVQIEQARVDPNLRNLRPLGWFVCHPHGDVSLSRSDRDTYNGFFPESWQVTLVLRALGGGTVRAGFFGRELDGTLKADASYEEFTLDSLHTPAAETDAVRVAPAPPASPPLVPKASIAEPAPLPTQPPSFQITEPVPSRERWLWAVPIALAVLLIGLALYHWRAAPAAPRSLESANQASAVQPEPDVKPTSNAQAPPPARADTPAPAPPADSSEATQLRAERDSLADQLRQKDAELSKERAHAEQLQNLVRILENRLNIQPDRTTSAAK